MRRSAQKPVGHLLGPEQKDRPPGAAAGKAARPGRLGAALPRRETRQRKQAKNRRFLEDERHVPEGSGRRARRRLRRSE